MNNTQLLLVDDLLRRYSSNFNLESEYILPCLANPCDDEKELTPKTSPDKTPDKATNKTTDKTTDKGTDKTTDKATDKRTVNEITAKHHEDLCKAETKYVSTTSVFRSQALETFLLDGTLKVPYLTQACPGIVSMGKDDPILSVGTLRKSEYRRPFERYLRKRKATEFRQNIEQPASKSNGLQIVSVANDFQENDSLKKQLRSRWKDDAHTKPTAHDIKFNVNHDYQNQHENRQIIQFSDPIDLGRKLEIELGVQSASTITKEYTEIVDLQKVSDSTHNASKPNYSRECLPNATGTSVDLESCSCIMCYSPGKLNPQPTMTPDRQDRQSAEKMAKQVDSNCTCIMCYKPGCLIEKTPTTVDVLSDTNHVKTNFQTTSEQNKLRGAISRQIVASELKSEESSDDIEISCTCIMCSKTGKINDVLSSNAKTRVAKQASSIEQQNGDLNQSLNQEATTNNDCVPWFKITDVRSLATITSPKQPIPKNEDSNALKFFTENTSFGNDYKLQTVCYQLEEREPTGTLYSQSKNETNSHEFPVISELDSLRCAEALYRKTFSFPSH